MKVVNETVLALLALGLFHCARAVLTPSRILQGRYVSVEIASHECDVTDYGAKGDGKQDDTKAIQKAFDDCGKRGGGTIVIPKGKTFTVFDLHFTSSNQELRLDGTLLCSDNLEEWDKREKEQYAILNANGFEHLAITGEGKVEGQGLIFWQNKNKHFRPKTAVFKHVKYAIISGPTLANSPYHVLELESDHTEVSHVTIHNPQSHGECEEDNTCSHNTDGVDVHGDPFYIHNVYFDTGDDNVAVHKNNTLIEDSKMGTGHGISIGSLCDVVITNLTVRNIDFEGGTNGLRIKSHVTQDKYGPGLCQVHVYDCSYQDITMKDVKVPIFFTQFYQSEGTPVTLFEKIHFKNMTITGGGKSKHDMPSTYVNFNCGTGVKYNCDHIVFEDVEFKEVDGNATKTGMLCTGGVRGTADGLKGINNCMTKDN